MESVLDNNLPVGTRAAGELDLTVAGGVLSAVSQLTTAEVDLSKAQNSKS
jgi:hypothetical protein